MLDSLSVREKQIIKFLTDEATIPVAELARRLAVSEVTVRTDLKHLGSRGLITRSHGGAQPAFHKHILDRQALHSEAKNRIARAAAELIQDGDTVMIVTGTTTALIPKYLLGKGQIHIVTDSTMLLAYARSNPALTLTVIGGQFKTATESFVGPLALEAIRRFNVRLAFLGTDGFSLERGVTTHFLEGAEMVKAMAGQAEHSILLADSSKWGRSGFVTVMPLARVDTLISDPGLDQATVLMLKEQGLEVVLA